MDTPLSKSVSVKVNPVNANAGYEPDIYVPKSFPEMGEDGKPIDPVWMFKAYELRYLDALHRGEDPEKAMEKAGITQRHINWLLKRKKTRDYMGQLLRQRLAAEAWSQEKWLHQGTEVWEGKKAATREQMEAWKEIGARICPKPEKSGSGAEKLIININVGAAESALKRQEIVEVEAIKTDGSVKSD